MFSWLSVNERLLVLSLGLIEQNLTSISVCCAWEGSGDMSAARAIRVQLSFSNLA